MKRLSLILLSLFTLLLVSCSAVRPTAVLNSVIPSSGYQVSTQKYGDHPRQSLDIYRPKISTKKSPIIFVYGGAWRSGSKSDYKFVAQALTTFGHPVIIPDYRLYPKVRFPAFIEDIADAVKFSQQNTQNILAKPFDEFILMGHSAGAHTAALLAADRSYFRKRNINAKNIGLISLAGPYDLPLDDPEVTDVFLGATPKQTKPVLNVYSGFPPTLLIHGEKDDRVFPFHTERFYLALKSKGNRVQKRIYPGVDHVKVLASLALPLRGLNNSYKDIERFLGTINKAEN